MEFKIEIRGVGTPDEIKKALISIIGGIDEAIESYHSASAILDGAEWEDETLYTEISEK